MSEPRWKRTSGRAAKLPGTEENLPFPIPSLEFASPLACCSRAWLFATRTLSGLLTKKRTPGYARKSAIELTHWWLILRYVQFFSAAAWIYIRAPSRASRPCVIWPWSMNSSLTSDAGGLQFFRIKSGIRDKKLLRTTVSNSYENKGLVLILLRSCVTLAVLNASESNWTFRQS